MSEQREADVGTDDLEEVSFRSDHGARAQVKIITMGGTDAAWGGFLTWDDDDQPAPAALRDAPKGILLLPGRTARITITRVDVGAKIATFTGHGVLPRG